MLLEKTEAGSAEEQPARDNPATEAYNPAMSVHFDSS